MQCIAFDSHKHYTWALVQDEKGRILREQRINHTRGALCAENWGQAFIFESSAL